MNDAEMMWSQIEAKELRLWLDAGRTGLWCDICNLPSAVEITVQSDPADEPELWGLCCTEKDKHPAEEEDVR